MEFVIGAVGAISVVLLIAGSILVGWKLRSRQLRYEQRCTAEKLTDKRRQELKEEQEAWRVISNYNAETAYKMSGPEIGKE